MRILVAEDEAVTRRVLESMLEEWGFEVEVAKDGIEAWEKLRRDDAPPLAILDWMMPGLNGLEVLEKVRLSPNGPYIYILMLTMRTEKLDVIRAMEAGADDYIGKPFDSQELRVRLRAGQRIVALQDELRQFKRLKT